MLPTILGGLYVIGHVDGGVLKQFGVVPNEINDTGPGVKGS